MRDKPVDIPVDGEALHGAMTEPDTGLPGVLWVHGWAGSQQRDRGRARDLARLGCVSLTFDMRGHGRTASQLRTVTREDNLADLCAAYDRLTANPLVDASCIAVVGSSYGGYLAALLTAERPVRWLALRAPALYRDHDWETPKFELDREDLALYRSKIVHREHNRALQHCQRFAGDVLIVESEHDEIVPHTSVASYLASFVAAQSVTYRVIKDADHALTKEEDRNAYNSLLVRWIREMIFGAR